MTSVRHTAAVVWMLKVRALLYARTPRAAATSKPTQKIRCLY